MLQLKVMAVVTMKQTFMKGDSLYLKIILTKLAYKVLQRISMYFQIHSHPNFQKPTFYAFHTYIQKTQNLKIFKTTPKPGNVYKLLWSQIFVLELFFLKSTERLLNWRILACSRVILGLILITELFICSFEKREKSSIC